MATLADEQEYTRIRQLPVIRELEEAFGKPPYEHLAGVPVSTQGRVRMPWVWFVNGQNTNLAIDHDNWQWTIRAGGRAGHVICTVGPFERVTHTMLRAVCVAAGLLDYPSVTLADVEGAQ
jgi:hypothetical protein